MSETTAAVSHGRGGAGNIGPDDTQYSDGGIHREGDPASTGGAYSAGRGGAGNIGSPSQKPVATGDDDIVPENAKVPHHDDQAYHTGRGGQGNLELPPQKEGEEPTKPVKTGGFKAKIKAFLARFKSRKSAKAAKAKDTDAPAAETTAAPAETTVAAEAPTIDAPVADAATTEPAK